MKSIGLHLVMKKVMLIQINSKKLMYILFIILIFIHFSFFRIYGFIIYYYSKYKLFNELFKRKDYDIIQVRDNAFDSLLALYLKQRYDVFFLFQYTFPTGSYQLKVIKTHFKKLYGVLDKFCINFILKKSRFYISISNLMKDDLVLSGINSDKIMPIPMGVNIDTFRQQSTDKIREEFKLFDSKVFLYVGTLSYLRKLDVMINAFSIVKKRYENVKLLIVGEGDDKLKLEKLVFSLKLEKDVIFTGSISYFDIPNIISSSDVCLCPVPPLEIYIVSSPTKLFEYMAINKPIVANKEIPEIRNVLDESGAGILVEFESNSFAEGMIKLLDDPVKARVMGLKGRDWVAKNRIYEHMTLEIEKIYFKLF